MLPANAFKLIDKTTFLGGTGNVVVCSDSPGDLA